MNERTGGRDMYSQICYFLFISLFLLGEVNIFLLRSQEFSILITIFFGLSALQQRTLGLSFTVVLGYLS